MTRWDLIKRCLFALVLVFLYLFLAKLPILLPNGQHLVSVRSNEVGGQVLSSLFAAGGDSLLALGLSPWMTTSMLWNLFARNEDGFLQSLTKGQKSLAQSLLTLFFALIQASVFLGAYPDFQGLSMIGQMSIVFQLLAVSFFLIWMVDLNHLFGFLGMSLFILTSIIYQQGPLVLKGLLGLGIPHLFLSLVCLLSLTFALVQVERARLRLPIRRLFLSSQLEDQQYLDLPLNPASSLPLLYGLILARLPIDLVSVLTGQRLILSKEVWILTYALSIVILSVSYSLLLFSPKQTAEKMQKNGDILAEQASGLDTRRYLEKKLYPLIGIGTVYLLILACLPYVFLPDTLASMFGLFLLFLGLIFQIRDPLDTYYQLTRKRKDWF